MKTCLLCKMEMDLFRDHYDGYWKCPRCQDVAFTDMNKTNIKAKKKIRKNFG